MAIAQAKTSRSKRDMRRSHHWLRQTSVVECANCHNTRLPHTACPHCGFYKGRQVISVKKD